MEKIINEAQHYLRDYKKVVAAVIVILVIAIII